MATRRRGGSSRRHNQRKRRPVPSRRVVPNAAGGGNRSRKQRMRARRRKRQLRRAVFLLMCAGIVFGIVQILLFCYVRGYDDGKIMEGVCVGELDVGGMTTSEAQKALQETIDRYGEGRLQLRVGESKTVETTYGELKLTANTKKLANQAMNYEKKGSLFKRFIRIQKCKRGSCTIPVQYKIDEKTGKSVLKELCEEVLDGPVNAALTRKSGKMVVAEGKNGEVLDANATIQEILQFLNKDWHGEDGVVSAKIKSTKPDIQAKDLQEVQDLLGTYETYYGADGSGRAQNIESGAKHTGGNIVMPGEEFSVNEAMEPYTEENGYTEAGSYENGTVVQTMGGGICQVSSTLYNALLLAEVEITQRQPHSMLVDYVEPSMDAAIAGDVKDLKFRNNYETPIYLECVLENGNVIFNIYGKETRKKGRTIEFVSETTDTEEAEGARFEATENYVGYYEVISAARTGVSAQLWKIVYEDGKEVSRDVVNQSYYASSPKVIGVGTVTNNDTVKSAILSAIASQNETEILSVINGDYEDSDDYDEEEDSDSYSDTEESDEYDLEQE